MISRGISSCATYIPKSRVNRADIFKAHAWALPGLRGKSKGLKSAASWDEDTTTMAVEALRGAMQEQTGSSINKLVFASTSAAFKDRSTAGIAAAALDLPATTFCIDSNGSRRAGTTALLDSLLSNQQGQQLIVAAEKRITQPGSWAEISWGDGAAAMVTDDDNPAASLIGWCSTHEDSLDFYWADGFKPYQAEERWIKDTLLKTQVVPVVNNALTMAKITAADIHWAVLCEPAPGSEKQLLRALKLDNATPITQLLLADAGDLGTALPLAGLAMALEQAKVGDNILVTGFGNGCDALVFTVNRAHSNKTSSVASQLAVQNLVPYTQFATGRGLLDLDFGPRAERVEKTFASVHERIRKDFTAFIGGKTSQDGPVQFPKSPIAADKSFVGSDGYIDVRLADLEATVVSVTTDHLTYTPEPPFTFGLVEFDNGARLPMEFSDPPKQGMAVGDKVRMQFRIKSLDTERGYRNYFWKATPSLTQEGV